jgi:Ca2+/Na+ antiporter
MYIYIYIYIYSLSVCMIYVKYVYNTLVIIHLSKHHHYQYKYIYIYIYIYIYMYIYYKVKTPKEYEREMDKLEAELIAKNFRISALDSQLIVSAQENSREIAKYRTKIFEMELARDDDDNGSGGDDDDDDDTPRDYIPHKTSPGGTGTRPPSGHAVRAANALRQSNTESIEKKAQNS